MRYTKILVGVAGLAIAGFSAPAQAERPADDPKAPNILSQYGASISVGGGVMGFTDSDMRDFASVGGGWDARLVYGTREFIAVEAAYTGNATSIDALGLDNDATLLSNGAEVLGRVNLMKREWQPYVVAGLGYRHFQIVNSDRNTSSVSGNEDIGEIPMGVGVAYRIRGLVVDGRGIFRAAFNDNLIDTAPGASTANQSSWGAQITAGYEF
jgi:hypothetical protein